jgi:hypothetical protein
MSFDCNTVQLRERIQAVLARRRSLEAMREILGWLDKPKLLCVAVKQTN